MQMNDNTILRIKVPAHLYESVKAQLTLKEGKNDYGMPEGTVIKEKKTSGDKPKAPSNTPKAPAVKKAKAPEMKDDVPHDGMKKVKNKKMGLEEFKALAELLHAEIAKLEEKEGKDEKTPIEEKKQGHEEEQQEGQE